jgi:hypothetical protein
VRGVSSLLGDLRIECFPVDHGVDHAFDESLQNLRRDSFQLPHEVGLIGFNVAAVIRRLYFRTLECLRKIQFAHLLHRESALDYFNRSDVKVVPQPLAQRVGDGFAVRVEIGHRDDQQALFATLPITLRDLVELWRAVLAATDLIRNGKLHGDRTDDALQRVLLDDDLDAVRLALHEVPPVAVEQPFHLLGIVGREVLAHVPHNILARRVVDHRIVNVALMPSACGQINQRTIASLEPLVISADYYIISGHRRY